VRNALIVVAVVALALVTLGAVNHGLLFDIDFVAGTWTAVSLFWVAVVTAGIVVVTGLVAALFARSGATAARRKLEKELQGTYERLRAAEAQLPKPAPSHVAVTEVALGQQTAVTGVVSAPAADETRVAEEAPPEAETGVLSAPPEAETAVSAAPPEAETAVLTAAPEAELAGTADVPSVDTADAPPPASS